MLFVDELHRRRFMPEGLVDLMEVLWCSVALLTEEVNRHVQEASPPDLLIRPSIPAGVTVLTGITHAAEVIAAGENAATEALPGIRALLPPHTV